MLMICILFLFTITSLTIDNFHWFSDSLGQNSSIDISILVKKGNDLVKLGSYNGAIVFYNKALAIDPNNIEALYNKGNALVKLGDSIGATVLYDKALAIDPNNKKVLHNKGLLLFKLGNYTELIK
ncbi:MAG TPA: tetratricopeptide repeat protein, partial [Candidatus Nitrosocosmicus sp.]